MTAARTSDTRKLRDLTFSGIFAGLIYVMTAYVHVPTGAGYTHAGDGLIFLAACLLPSPYAAAAAAVGGALADGLSGFAVWLPATIIIKAVTTLYFSTKSDKIITKRNIAALLPALVTCVAGYSLYQGIFMSGHVSTAALAAAFAQTPAYCIQIAASSVLFIFLGIVLDRMRFKARYFPKH
ncbi:TIGR04002 family protein [Ruminococcus sp.]|uniref:TIGR04002 family protein n=1 Tax=Ruminococcus sp. TaxID=41978 RepID=UPI0025DC9380|nr:TIGR04002 family protein [Ruminococcus sp.]MBQ8966182.1 TIGR04002 family protein [Ruminococcus sp.]